MAPVFPERLYLGPWIPDGRPRENPRCGAKGGASHLPTYVGHGLRHKRGLARRCSRRGGRRLSSDPFSRRSQADSGDAFPPPPAFGKAEGSRPTSTAEAIGSRRGARAQSRSAAASPDEQASRRYGQGLWISHRPREAKLLRYPRPLPSDEPPSLVVASRRNTSSD